jgi:biofilm PGA synthesis lipoprotein PgaB
MVKYNELSLIAAREAGMPMTMGLVDGFNTLANINALRRLIIVDDPNISKFAEIITGLRV